MVELKDLIRKEEGRKGEYLELRRRIREGLVEENVEGEEGGEGGKAAGEGK